MLSYTVSGFLEFFDNGLFQGLVQNRPQVNLQKKGMFEEIVLIQFWSGGAARIWTGVYRAQVYKPRPS